MKERLAHLALILICLRLSVGCGSTINGETEEIKISSNPTGAELWIDGVRIGSSPAEVTLKRRHDHLISLKKDGYKDITVKIESSTSEWLFANVWVGFWPGCLLDIVTGGAYKLEPERVEIDMGKVAYLGGSMIYIDRAQLDNVRQLRILDSTGKPETMVDILWVE